MRSALHAEWTKLRTVAEPAWLVLAAVVLTVLLSALISAGVTCPPAGCAGDPTKLALSGVYLGQAVVAVLAVLAVGAEYGTGVMRTTLTAMPGRTRVLLAKAATVTGPVLVAGAVAVLGSLVAGRLWLPSGYTAPSLADGPTLRAAGGTVLYLGLVALLSLGIAVLVRESAVAIGVVLGLLYLFPMVAALVTDPHWERRLRQWGPSEAGLAIQNTTHLRGLPLSPWAGLGVLGLWALGALLVGGAALRLRDA